MMLIVDRKYPAIHAQADAPLLLITGGALVAEIIIIVADLLTRD